MSTSTPRKVSLRDVPVDHRRGGRIQLLLSPRSAGATSGFMGVGVLQPGEFVIEHRHPYSEEFVYVVSGVLTARIEGESYVQLRPDDGLLIPKGVRHRFENNGEEPAKVVFHNGPLAPRPDLGHIDTEPLLEEGPPPNVGGPVATGGPS
ncbi:cupin domain-containing protein [Nonomuraea insulae]|uniref:Cupin domain-containing protein n=1 Tax=Nonomuraea insulae TaxID=1616787 RepID=A0ABW1CQ94_9ACTN